MKHDTFLHTRGTMKIPTIVNVTGKSSARASLCDTASMPAENRLAQIPGQEVRGEVLARLADDAYLVKIAGTVFAMEIPLHLEPGSSLQLTCRCSQPRPTFTMRCSADDAASVSLSSTAALLTRTCATGEASRTNASQFAPRILLQGNTPPDPRVLATALRDAISFSGLFYESHLLQWYLGEIPLSSIMREVRAGLPRQIRHDHEKAAEGSGSGESGVNADKTENDALSAQVSNHDSSEEVSAFSSQKDMQLVREQLDLLLSGTFSWRGEAMAGHEMEWQVERDPDGENSGAAQSWETSISVRLPNLGHICAVLSFSPEGIECTVQSELPETAALLEKEAEILRDRLDKSGIRLKGMVIEIEK